MKKYSLVIFTVVAVVAVAAGYYSILKKDIEPGYLNFIPENPYLQIEFQNPEKLSSEFKKLKIFELLEENGLNQKMLNLCQEIISEAADNKLSEVKKNLGKMSRRGAVSTAMALVEGEKQPIQLIAVAEFKVDNSAETVAKIFGNITEDIISGTESEFQTEKTTYNGHEIFSLRLEQEVLNGELQLAAVDNFILLGIGNDPLEEAFEHSKNLSPASSLFDKKTENFELAAKIRPGLIAAIIDFAEEKSELDDRYFSFDGFKKALARIGAGITDFRTRLYIEEKIMKIDTKLNYRHEKLHPLFKLDLSVPPRETAGAAYFPEKTTTFTSSHCPELERLLTVLLDSIVDIVESSAGREVKSQAKMFSGMFRGGFPEDDLKKLLGLLGPELAVGSFLPEGSDEFADESWLILLGLQDYDEFLRVGEVLDENDFINFSTVDNSISLDVSGMEKKLFFNRDGDKLLFSLDKNLLEKASALKKSGNNLANYSRFKEARQNYRQRLNDFSFYNIEAFAPLVKEAELDYPGFDFLKNEKLSEIKTQLIPILQKMPPASVATINRTDRGISEAKLRDPGLTLITLTALRALAETENVRQMSCESRAAKFKSDIASLRTAAVQCQMADGCDHTRLDENWSDFLPERFWNPEKEETWEIETEDGRLKRISVDDIGCRWTDRFDNSGSGMLFDVENGEFLAVP